MTAHVVYIGNLTDDAALQMLLPAGTEFVVRDAWAAMLYTENAQVAQQLAKELDGRCLNGQSISAIERERLEAALDTARTSRCSRFAIALATRLGLTSRDRQDCLQRLIALWGEDQVAITADQALQQAKTQADVAAEMFFTRMLGSLHPVAAQALRDGSLRKAEGISQPASSKQTCEPITDPVMLELERRKECQRRARRELTRLRLAGVEDGPTFARAVGQLRDADAAVESFLERFYGSTIRRKAGYFRPVAVHETEDGLG